MAVSNYINYLMIGDSVSIDNPNFLRYPIAARSYIKSKGNKVVYINRAYSGWTAAGMGLATAWCSNYDVDLAIINIGINDANNGVYTSAFDTYLQKVINRLKARNSSVKIILCCPHNVAVTDTTRTTNLPAYRTAIANLAVLNNCSICKFEDAWTQEMSATYTSDGLHPNVAGHQLLFNLLKPIIDEILG